MGSIPGVIGNAFGNILEVDDMARAVNVIFLKSLLTQQFRIGNSHSGLRKHDPDKGMGRQCMSYTAFAYGMPELTKADDEVVTRIPVTNTGKTTGTEIVQVYVSVPASNVERHVRELKGFVRIGLQVGETRTTEIHIPVEELKYYDEETGSWILEQTDARMPSTDVPSMSP